jgi:hypothetical protein
MTLIGFVVLCLVVGLILWLLTHVAGIAIDPRIVTLIIIALALVLIVILLQWAGLLSGRVFGIR